MTGTFLLAKRSNLPREYASTRERLPRGVSRAGAIRVSQNSVPHPAKHARKRLTQMQAGGRGCTRMGHRPSQYRGLPGSPGQLSCDDHPGFGPIFVDLRASVCICVTMLCFAAVRIVPPGGGTHAIDIVASRCCRRICKDHAEVTAFYLGRRPMHPVERVPHRNVTYGNHGTMYLS